MKLFGLELTWNGFDVFHNGNFDPSGKVDKSGDSMTGKLTLPVSTTAQASINIPHGTAPTTPINGDTWTTTSAPMVRINGTTRTIYHSGNAGTAALTTATQTEAEAGTSTTVRAWTPQRILQAIVENAAAIVHTHVKADITDMPTNLSQFINDIGAGAGLNIVSSPTEPVLNTGDWWYQEI